LLTAAAVLVAVGVTVRCSVLRLSIAIAAVAVLLWAARVKCSARHRLATAILVVVSAVVPVKCSGHPR
jgi:hypothetical protein